MAVLGAQGYAERAAGQVPDERVHHRQPLLGIGRIGAGLGAPDAADVLMPVPEDVDEDPLRTGLGQLALVG